MIKVRQSYLNKRRLPGKIRIPLGMKRALSVLLPRPGYRTKPFHWLRVKLKHRRNKTLNYRILKEYSNGP